MRGGACMIVILVVEGMPLSSINGDTIKQRGSVL